jgi:hypothetical protein
VGEALEEYRAYKDQVEPNSQIPWNAVLPRTFIEASRPKEIRRPLKFGRGSDWLSKITVASALDDINSISVTRDLEWEGCTGDVDWFWDKFVQLSAAHGLKSALVAYRQGNSWFATLRKENNSIRVALHEKRTDGILIVTPEDPGIPPYLLYGLKATTKTRCASMEIVEQYMLTLYGPGITCTERLHRKESASAAALNGGEISIRDRVIRDESVAVQPEICNQRIFEAGLRTQNYDKGCEHFVGKFNSEEPIEAVMALVKGHIMIMERLFASYKRKDVAYCLTRSTGFQVKRLFGIRLPPGRSSNRAQKGSE